MSAVVTAIVATTVAAAGIGYSIYAGEQGKKAQERAMSEQRTAQKRATLEAEKQATASEAAMRRAAGRQPDIASIMAAAQEGAAGGPSATMLTGPQGIDPSQLSLGRSTLLGS